MPYIGTVSEFSEAAYAGRNIDKNYGRRNVSMKSAVGTGDDDVILLLENVGWARKIVVWPRSGTVEGQMSVDGVTWTTVYWRNGTARVDDQYRLDTGNTLTGSIYFIDGDGPSGPFIRFRQVGGTAARADVFLQG